MATAFMATGAFKAIGRSFHMAAGTMHGDSSIHGNTGAFKARGRSFHDSRSIHGNTRNARR